MTRRSGRWLPGVGGAVAITVLLLVGTARSQTPPPAPAATATPAPPTPSTEKTPAAAPAAGAAAENPAAKAEEPPKCADCHTDLVKQFATNPHARFSQKDKTPDPSEVCATCHGDGTKHMESGGDPSLIGTFLGVAGANDCLSCHVNAPGEHASFTIGFHANTAAVNCLSCHSVHKSAPKSEHMLAKMPGELCGSCHMTETASFANKPYVHRLNRGGMTCLDCHAPHDRRGEPVKMTVAGELPCLNCHAELRGPFVFDHVTGSGGNCLSCHQPHGSNNPNMLLWSQVSQLCLSCHSQTGGPPTLGSQPPSFHNISLPRYRNCTTCHVAVHGSNLSPQLLK